MRKRTCTSPPSTICSIKTWPKADRPREKLIREGEHKLSDTELLAILLRTGIRGSTAIDLARRIFRKHSTFRSMSYSGFSDWKDFKGLGIAKIAQIKAAIEIGRRFGEEKRAKQLKIRSSKDVIDILMARMRDLPVEVFKILLLDSKSRLIDIVEISEGIVDRVTPFLRKVFEKAFNNFAVSIICVHNHPTGNPTPSSEDKRFTKRLVYAGHAVGIYVLDHIIIGDNTYFSFADKEII